MIRKARLYDKVWEAHVVRPESASAPAIIYVDLHLVHEVTSPQAFETLRRRGVPVRCPERTLATMDHATPTLAAPPGGDFPFFSDSAREQAATLEGNCRENGVELLRLGDLRQGIVHVVGPELGRTRPGETIVCGDSHTATHGAFGALAFGIGTSEVAHVLATQCLLQRKTPTMGIRVDGTLSPGVTAKDMILAIIRKIGVDGATGHTVEYYGSGISALDMEERMTVSNMSIEAGARAGMIAPDGVTFEYLSRRPDAPHGRAWDRALSRWRRLRTDDPGEHDRRSSIDASKIEPMITYGTNPGMSMPVGDRVPEPVSMAARRALDYMGIGPGECVLGRTVDVVFIGSCTNGRLSDLRLAAAILEGRRVAGNTRLFVVPGSQAVKREAEAEGIDRIVRAAGGEWREAGCSMCLAMNGDRVEPGALAVSTSNRNFEGRQGPGARTMLASPATAAASAVRGRVADPRALTSSRTGSAREVHA